MKNLMKAATAFMCVASIAAIVSPVAKADLWDKMTTVTFSGPVEIPGSHVKGYAILPAGTYVFKLMDSNAERHIVQIFTADRKKIIATIIAIPNMRLKPTSNTVITFKERPNGEPPALRAWFYPSASYGDEFVYSKTKAKQIAQQTNTPVLYNNTETEPPSEVAEIQPPQPEEVQKMNQAEIKAYSPAGDEQELSQAVTAPPPAQMQAQNTPPPAPAPTPSYTPTPAPSTTSSSTPAQLPQTASPLGWLMLSGILMLFAGFGVGMIRKLVS